MTCSLAKSYLHRYYVRTMRAGAGRRTREGKAKMHILVAVGRKLLSVLYSMLKTGAAYDPDWEENRRLAPARP